MNVWKISTKKDENNILNTTERESRKLDDFLSGESMAKNWDPTLRIYVDEKTSNVEYLDALRFDMSYFVLSEKAMELFLDFAKDTIECLPFQFDKEGYMIVNPLEVVDCLDMERSDYKVYKGAKDTIQFYKKLYFVKGDLEGKHLFRIHHMDRYLVACSDEFKEAVEKAGLTGFVFDKLSDEIVETRAPKGSIKKEKVICQKKETPYQLYQKKVIEFITKEMATDKKLEEFYALMDELEGMAQEDKRYYALLSNCYENVDDFVNASRCFEQVYQSKDKKAMKRHIYLSNTRKLVRIRPSKRSKKIPSFRYVDKKVLKDYFVQAELGENCCICGRENVIFYAGYAYENSKCKVFSADEERFCSDCLVTGRAAKERNIVFNSGLIEGFSDMQEEKKKTLLYGTPGVRHNFDMNEELWPECCDDFCCFMGKSRYSSKFQCLECGNKIVWENFT